MALSRYVLTATVTVPADTAATPVAGEPATGGAAGYGSTATTGGPLYPHTFIKGTPIIPLARWPAVRRDRAGNLRAWVQGQDDVGHAALGN